MERFPIEYFLEYDALIQKYTDIIKPMLPTKSTSAGRPIFSWQKILVAIIFIAVNGHHWKYLPKSTFGTSTTIRNYIHNWSTAGVFDKMRSHDLLGIEMGEILCAIARLEKDIKRKEDARDMEWIAAYEYWYEETETVLQELRSEMAQDTEMDLIMDQIAYEDFIYVLLDEIYDERDQFAETDTF